MRQRAVSVGAIVLTSALGAAAQPSSPPQPLPLLTAVRSAIARHPLLEIAQQQVNVEDAAVQQAASAFDGVVGAAAGQSRVYVPSAGAAGVGGLLIPLDTSQLGASYERLLRNGVSVRGAIDLERGVQATDLASARTAVEVSLPLLRGRGTRVNTSHETASANRANAARLDVRHTTAVLMTRVVSSYWDLVAAQRRLTVAVEAAERGERLVESMRALVAGDQIPRAELASATANLAARIASRFTAEQGEIEARQQLLLDMGLGSNSLPATVGLDDFPPLTPLPPGFGDAATVDRLVRAALDHRGDYRAAQLRLKAAQVVRDVATNALQPQVDLTVDVGYTGISQGGLLARYFAGLGTQVRGPDVTTGIKYTFPAENRFARSQLAAADAEYRQAQLKLADVERSITSAVVSAISGVGNSIQRLQKAHEAVEAFEAALEGERDKLALGVGSTVSLLTIEDRLTAASSNEVAAWQAYGRALVELRFATGSLVPLDDSSGAQTESVSTFTTLPRVAVALPEGRP
jgi:outer membrane protein